MTPTPHELRLAERRRDAQLDCSAEELTARQIQRAKDRAAMESIRRMHRRMDLSEASRADLQERRWERAFDERKREQERLRDAAEAEWIAFGGVATADQINAWKEKYRSLMTPFKRKLEPVTIVAGTAATPTWKSAADLLRRQFEPVRFVVPKYVAEGLTLLAGRPKIGKSWLTDDMALAVAAGGEVLGENVGQGDVLLLALEDNERRLQSRFKTILGPFREAPAGLTYATEWPRVDEGGLDKIRAWIESASNPRLIVVDVLARVRSQQQGRQAQYEADYAAIAGLQSFASEKRVAIVVVHHLRKGAADSGDAIDKISGTLGLSGAADSVLILDRDGQGVNLYARGRDIEEIEMATRFDSRLCRWKVLGAASEVRRSDERKIILDALKEASAPMLRSELAAATGLAPNNLDQLLWKMCRAGQTTKSGRGIYQLAGTSQRMILPPPPC